MNKITFEELYTIPPGYLIHVEWGTITTTLSTNLSTGVTVWFVGTNIVEETKLRWRCKTQLARSWQGTPPQFLVSLDNMSMESDTEMKVHILHEVGHLNHDPALSREEGEYQAQIWGNLVIRI